MNRLPEDDGNNRIAVDEQSSEGYCNTPPCAYKPVRDRHGNLIYLCEKCGDIVPSK